MTAGTRGRWGLGLGRGAEIVSLGMKEVGRGPVRRAGAYIRYREEGGGTGEQLRVGQGGCTGNHLGNHPP